MNHAQALDFQRTYYPLIRQVVQEIKTVRDLILPNFGEMELLDVCIQDIQLPDIPEPYPPSLVRQNDAGLRISQNKGRGICHRVPAVHDARSPDLLLG